MSFLKRVLSTKRDLLSDVGKTNLAAFDVNFTPKTARQRHNFLNDCDLVIREMIKDVQGASSAEERSILRSLLLMHEERFFEVGKLHVALEARV